MFDTRSAFGMKTWRSALCIRSDSNNYRTVPILSIVSERDALHTMGTLLIDLVL